jgi:hypothetical protein
MRCEHHGRAAIGVAVFGLMFALMLPTAEAQIGPCQPDGRNGLVCGTGIGGARAIDGSISPSKRFALAWSSKKTGPLDQDVDNWPYDLEDMVIRISDGAVLARVPGIYFDTGGVHANRAAETGSWSPDSHYLVETVEDRWSTPRFELYAIEADDKLIGPVDLKKIMEPVLRARLRAGGVNDKGYDLQLYEDPHTGAPVVTIGRDGTIRTQAMLHVAKSDKQTTYDVALRIMQKGDALSAKLVSVKLSRPQPW